MYSIIYIMLATDWCGGPSKLAIIYNVGYIFKYYISQVPLNIPIYICFKFIIIYMLVIYYISCIMLAIYIYMKINGP